MAAEPGTTFTVLPRGALVQDISVNGMSIVQGFPTAELYGKHNAPYFGETIGRIANRISGAKLDSVNGKSYPLAANNGPNSLHGGSLGWGKKDFHGPTYVTRNGRQATLFTYLSPDGEEGYPGTVEVRVWYSRKVELVDGVERTDLEIEYEVELVGDDGVEETVVAMTNHSYFNLTGGPSIAGTEVTLSTDQYQVVDKGGIPLGPIESYPGIPKANQTFVLGPTEPDIDDCFITNLDPASVPVDTRPLPVALQASFYHPASGIHLEAHSTEPAFQFYTGRFIDVPAIKEGGYDLPPRGPRSAFCLEPSRYVNAVNVEECKGMVLLKRGQKYGSRIVYRTWAD